MPGIPAGWRYSPDHLWACLADDGGGLVRIGVTDFAQRSLGDITGVTLPSPGDTVTGGQAWGTIESGNGVTDLIAPLTGTVRARNDDLAAAPGLVNTDPYGHGWMIEVQTDPATLGDQLSALLDAAAYRKLTGA